MCDCTVCLRLATPEVPRVNQQAGWFNLERRGLKKIFKDLEVAVQNGVRSYSDGQHGLNLAEGHRERHFSGLLNQTNSVCQVQPDSRATVSGRRFDGTAKASGCRRKTFPKEPELIVLT